MAPAAAPPSAPASPPAVRRAVRSSRRGSGPPSGARSGRWVLPSADEEVAGPGEEHGAAQPVVAGYGGAQETRQLRTVRRAPAPAGVRARDGQGDRALQRFGDGQPRGLGQGAFSCRSAPPRPHPAAARARSTAYGRAAQPGARAAGPVRGSSAVSAGWLSEPQRSTPSARGATATST